MTDCSGLIFNGPYRADLYIVDLYLTTTTTTDTLSYLLRGVSHHRVE